MSHCASDTEPIMTRRGWLPVVTLFALLSLATLPAAAPAAPSGPDITGQYRAVRSGMVVTIGVCGGARMCGRIVALGDLPPTDTNNPAPALQARPLCGATVLDRLEWQGGSWNGTLYDPQNGTDYRVSVNSAEKGAVRITGHSGRPVLSRTMSRPFEVWERVAPPAAPCDAAAATG
jgi:uncharacterized protein (DUF2147 family)